MLSSVWSRAFQALQGIINDALYRGSLVLLASTAVSSVLGFVFWTLAAHIYPASTVGTFSSITAGVALLAAIAGLGLENTMIRNLANAENARQMVVLAIVAITTAGTILCFLVLLALGPHLPGALHLKQHGALAFLVSALVAFTAVSGIVDAGLIAIRESFTVFITNLAGSITKIVVILFLTNSRSYVLLISYSVALALSTVWAGVALVKKSKGAGVWIRSVLTVRRYLSLTSGSYLATILGILPAGIVPIEILVKLGPAETARFTIAGMAAGTLNVIPSTVAQVFFAEASRQGVPLGGQLRKALRSVYALLLPAVMIMVAIAPFILSLFGASYAAAATSCLRILALSVLITGGTYLVDSVLIARDRIGAFIFINAANATLVLGFVGILVPHGITAAACGWALAQGVSLLLGLTLLATGRMGRHHPKASSFTQAAGIPSYAGGHPRTLSDAHAFEPQIRELLASWPMMPTTMIAERIGWDQSIRVLFDDVTELRDSYSWKGPAENKFEYAPGEIAQCGFWFPPVEVPVGSGQTASPRHLPVLTMITGYSRWLSAVLIHSMDPQDLIEGCWELLAALGALPRVLIWDTGTVMDRYQLEQSVFINSPGNFWGVLDTRVITASAVDPAATNLIKQMHIYLERSFLPRRVFASPVDFNAQLCEWVDTVNSWRRRPPRPSPVDLIGVDALAMRPLPAKPSSIGWRQLINVGPHPFICFDSNEYSVPPGMIGHTIELVVNSSKVRILCDGALVAEHVRSWAHNVRIADPYHITSRR